jgi:hypothetical protein
VNRNLLLLALLVALLAISTGCGDSQNSNANSNPLAAPTPTPDKAAIEAELIRIEKDWPRILKERDAASVRKIEADDIFLVYPDGNDGTKEQDVKDIESGALASAEQQISEVTVNVIDNDSAVVRLRITVKGDQYKISTAKCQEVIHEFRAVDTFARRNGQWQMVASVSVPVMNPTATPTPSPSPSPVGAKASPSPKPSTAPKATPASRPTAANRPSPTTKPAARPSPRTPPPVTTKTP